MCRNIKEMIYKSFVIVIFLYIYVYDVGMMYWSFGVMVGCIEEIIILMWFRD